MTARTRSLALAAALLIAGGALAGCTGGDPEPTPTSTATDAAAEPGVTDITDAPGSGEGLTGALADTTTDTCEKSGDGWSVVGTVTNSSDAAADYRIYVSLLNGANDTRGLQQVNVTAVEPGATNDWESSIAVADDDLTCVLRVERYPAAASEG
ncbi:MAG: hypothetical protein ABW024_03600 [Microbacterium sp.]